MKVKFNILFCFFLGSVMFSRARGEDVNITTFYPVPSGVYQSLESETLAIGDRAVVEPPSEEGVIRFQPRGEPSRGKSGELYFDEGGSKFKYYDGSTWKALGMSTGSTCGWFRGECPVGWGIAGPGEEYRRQIKNDDLPVSGNQYRYIWRELHEWHMNQYYVCEPRNVDLDNPPTDFIASPMKKRHDYDERFCGYCYGSGCTDYKKVYSNTGKRVEISVNKGGGAVYHLYLYRCIYPGDPEALPRMGVYNMSYCCPSD